MGSGIAGAITPDLQTAGGAFANVLNASGNTRQVGANTIASQMSPYMNQYVNLALQPQLAQAANAYMLQSQAQQGAATSAGAFGDPRAAILQGNLGLNYALENQGLVGNAYNAAFNTAIGAGAQDVANNLGAQEFNVGSGLNALNLQLGAANSTFGAAQNAATLENTFGSQQTAQSQAQLNALYNQWLMKQQYPFQTTGLVNSTIGAAQGVTPINVNGTTTTTTPNNAGYALLGAMLGAGGTAASGYFQGQAAAEGGNISKGKPSLVGEKGPELFVPHEHGSVVPYEKLREAMAKKKGVKAPKHNAAPANLRFGLAA
jgi:hypothetical protein